MEPDKNSINLDVDQGCRLKRLGYLGWMKGRCEAVVDATLAWSKQDTDAWRDDSKRAGWQQLL